MSPAMAAAAALTGKLTDVRTLVADEADHGTISRPRSMAVPIDEVNVDTNQLCPTRFNKVPRGPGYARILFHDRRFDAQGNENADFVLNREPYRRARIIVAERNFGCGSSRESAVYALHAFGVRSIIAPSFGDIFTSNCLKNGLLPVRVPAEVAADMRRQLHAQVGATVKVDLAQQTVTGPDGQAASLRHPPTAQALPARRP